MTVTFHDLLFRLRSYLVRKLAGNSQVLINLHGSCINVSESRPFMMFNCDNTRITPETPELGLHLKSVLEGQ